MLMLAAALLLRCWWFGDPVVQVDEQFYLLMGDRLLHGALPFVDIWDRKPIGLFLVYAAIRLLGGAGIVQYQIVAALFAAAAAFLVVRIARLFASEAAARAAGAAALLWLIVFDGAGGQAPIFYDPLVAGAGFVTLRAAMARSLDPGELTRRGAVAMLLLGLAIQIKYTVISEGIAFGLMLLWQGRRRGERPATLAGQAALWMAIAVAPTALVLAAYVARGYGEVFVYANFLSIGDRAGSGSIHLAARLGTVAAYALPLAIAAFAGLRRRREADAAEQVRRFVLLWLIAAAVGFVSIGTFYRHYFLPALVPLAIAAAPALDAARRGMRAGAARLAPAPALALLGAGALLAIATSRHRLHVRGDGSQVETLAAAIEARPGRCLFVFDGEPILYHLTRSCLASRYAFPSHLNQRNEAGAIGVDPAAEVRRILAARPGLIVSSDRPGKGANPRTWAMMRRALALHYLPVARVAVDRRVRILYVPRTASPPSALAAGAPAATLS